jgi:hypothetical protein
VLCKFFKGKHEAAFLAHVRARCVLNGGWMDELIDGSTLMLTLTPILHGWIRRHNDNHYLNRNKQLR